MNRKWKIIFDYLMYLIRSNEVGEDEILPSQNQLKTKFKCSEQPIREAYKKLIELQMVRPVRGRGFVTQKKDENNNLFSFREFFPETKNLYFDLELITINHHLQEKSKMILGQKVWRFHCQRQDKENNVILFQESILPYDFFKNLTLDCLNQFGLMNYIEKYSPIKLGHALKNIYFDGVPKINVDKIFNGQVKNGVIIDQGYLYSIYGELVEFRTSYYNPNKFNWKFIEWRK